MPKLPFFAGGSDSIANDSSASSSSKRLLLTVGLGVLGLLVLLVGVPKLLGGSDEAGPIAVATHSVRPVSPRPSPSPSDGVQAPTDYRNVVVRDPFTVQYADTSGASATSPGQSTSTTNPQPSPWSAPSTPSYSGGSSGGTTTPTTPTPTTPTTPTTSKPKTSTKHTSLTARGAPSAYGSTYRVRFVVDGVKSYTVVVGDSFAGSLTLRSVHSNASGVLYATVQYRNRVPFDIVAGQTVKL